MEDGTAPHASVVIERVCGTARRAETRTDGRGRFGFQVGTGALSPESDATSNAGFGGRSTPDDAINVRACEITAVLSGYRSTVVNLGQYSAMGVIDTGTIILKPINEREGDTVSLVNAMAPKNARKALERGRQLLAKARPAEARQEFETAVGVYPNYAAAWVELGRLQVSLKQTSEARQSFQKAIATDPKYLPPYDGLGAIAFAAQNWKDLSEVTAKMIQLNAFQYPQIYYLNALANLNLFQADAAMQSAHEALKVDAVKFARAEFILGLAWALKGDAAQAIEHLKVYLATNPQEADVVRKRIAEIEKQQPRPQ